MLQVDNSQVISFKGATCIKLKLKGMISKRWDWVKELQDMEMVKTVKVDTLVNVADLLTKCQSAVTQNRLIQLMDDRVIELSK